MHAHARPHPCSLLVGPDRFAGLYRDVYVTALSVGEGMTGVVASALIWVQLAPGFDHPLFPVSVYFWLLGAVMLLSLAAFHLLHSSKRGRAQRLHEKRPPPKKRISGTDGGSDGVGEPLLSDSDGMPPPVQFFAGRSRRATAGGLGIQTAEQNQDVQDVCSPPLSPDSHSGTPTPEYESALHWHADHADHADRDRVRSISHVTLQDSRHFGGRVFLTWV